MGWRSEKLLYQRKRKCNMKVAKLMRPRYSQMFALNSFFSTSAAGPMVACSESHSIQYSRPASRACLLYVHDAIKVVF